MPRCTRRRKKGRVVEVVKRVIFGSAATLEEALANSEVSRTVNTSFVERHNGTDRNRNAQEGAEDVLFLEGLVDSSGGCQFRSGRAQLFRASRYHLGGCGANRLSVLRGSSESV